VKINSMEISDFFRQLSLLTNSGLPLPETLRQLAASTDRTKIKTMIEECGEAAGKGVTLSDALRKYSDDIPSFYVRMIAIGEREGTLPDVLAELAKITRMHHQLTVMIKDIMIYPFITISVGFLIFLVLSYAVIPEFHKIFIELLEGAPMPSLTELTITISSFIREYIYVFVALYLAYLAVMIKFLIDRRFAGRLLFYLIRRFPFADVIFYNYAMSRLCSMWATLMRRRVPTEEAFPAIAEVMDFPPLEAALIRVADSCRRGAGFIDAMDKEPDISRLLVMSVKNTPEQKLPEQLDQLTTLFQERGSYGFRRAGMAWELISIGGMIMVVGGIIFMLFLPFFSQMFR